MPFLPVNREEMLSRGWERPDFVYVSGDAYVDHPSFGHAIITRMLESRGYKVSMLAQPDWRNIKAFKEFGRPRLGFLVSSGNIDSMVNAYTAAKRPRSRDVYSPGGKTGLRPNRADIVYTNCIRQAYKNIPVILGGVEASLRRLAHYDYWEDRVRASILVDSGADLLLFGMGERSIIELADALEAGIPIKDITYINGSAYIAENLENVYDYEIIESFEEVRDNKRAYAQAFMKQYAQQSPQGKRLVQKHGKIYAVCNPPQEALSREEMDQTYSLPYERDYHPMYKSMGGVPAIEEVKYSITSSRGCFGGCNFCALTFHQGRKVTSRSHASILEEARVIIGDKDFKGYIHDVGGPTANFRFPACSRQEKSGPCLNKQCLFPAPCANLKADHSDYIQLLEKLRKLPGVKKVFVRSGIRFDYVLADKKNGMRFMEQLCRHHVSGQLKVAPEHVAPGALAAMGKPEHKIYERFREKFYEINQRMGKEQYLVPYLMSSHPGCTLQDAVGLAEYLRDINHMPEQVQDFYPTPGTMSTCMFYTGLDPRTMREVYVPRSPLEKAMQRALIQYKKPENYELVKKALVAAGRQELIGFDKKCLIKPRNIVKSEPRRNGRGRERSRNRSR